MMGERTSAIAAPMGKKLPPRLAVPILRNSKSSAEAVFGADARENINTRAKNKTHNLFMNLHLQSK